MNSKSISYYIICSVLIAAVYYASGIVIKPLILPPTFAAPIWPAAGIGVGVLVLWGYKYIPSILIGELLLNLKFYNIDEFVDKPELMLTYGGLLIATILRSVLGSYLVKRHLGKSNSFLTLSSVAKLFILAGLIPTFVSSSLAMLSLSIGNLLDVNSVMINFATWWFGDSVGIFIVLPLMFLLFKVPRDIWKPRLLKTAFPVIVTFSLLVVIALNLKQLEKKRIAESLDHSVSEVFNLIINEYSNNNPKLHEVPLKQLIATINTLFVEYAPTIASVDNLKDTHFIIYSVDDNTKTKLFSSDETFNTSAKNKAHKTFEISEHQWEIEAYATSQYYVNNGSWLIWWLLSIGFLFTAFLGAGLLIITGNTILIKDKVRERTREIDTLNKILIESESRYKQLIEIQPVIFWRHVRGDIKLDYISDEAANILGYPKKYLVDLDIIWNKLLHPEDRTMVLKQYHDGVSLKKRFILKYRAVCKNGNILWFKDFVSSKEVDGRVEVVGLKIDITKDQERERKISQLAYYDTMTKLPNRVRFMMYLKKAVKKSLKNGTFGAVLFLDLDRFKVLNDSMGHYFGDKLLIKIGNRLNKALINTDISSRFGGDEFVVLVGKQNKSLAKTQRAAKRVAEKIQIIIKEPFDIDGHYFYTSFSTGISIFPYNSDKSDEIIQQADIAMYFSKTRGKNAVSFFKKEMQQEANRRLHIEKSLKIALLRHEFEMYYQPIFDQDKKILKLEALIRWNHPEEGLLMPQSFIQIAEETGFIVELSEWIIENVFDCLDQWGRSNDVMLPVSINISLFQFSNTQLIEVLESASHKYCIDTSMVTLELTESIGIGDFEEVLIKLHKLKALGFMIAIDDFGSGYSSLNYLTQMPIDVLKLDKSFIAKIGVESNTETLIETIVLMSKQLNLDIIIEGVETESQFIFLKNLGCQTFQGYILSKALPFKKLKQFLSERG
ncbi:MAG: EAL domain-containing protein [Alcanivoracaceae bacterium]|nr:EAL domain-containing protein [Alcanivoracaceae bacterium]